MVLVKGNKMAYQENGFVFGVKRKVFISHYKGDKDEVEAFIDEFCKKENVFIPRILGANENYDFIDSSDTSYVMTQIRKKYLEDSTVTIVLIGSCTHSRRYVDWELKSSLRKGQYIPNGVLGILLKSKGSRGQLPPRLKDNWSNSEDCYALYRSYPSSSESLHHMIEKAFLARTTKNHLIVNSQQMMKNNSKCKVCKITH